MVGDLLADTVSLLLSVLSSVPAFSEAAGSLSLICVLLSGDVLSEQAVISITADRIIADNFFVCFINSSFDVVRNVSCRLKKSV